MGYAALEHKLGAGRCVILDGGIGSELERLGFPREDNTGALWGTRALYQAPELVRAMHQGYAAAGADVLTTNTWQLGTMPAAERDGLVSTSSGDWRSHARAAVALARSAAEPSYRDRAVAFSLSVRCLGRPFLDQLLEAVADEPPDLFLVETLTTLPDDASLQAFSLLTEIAPLWLAYRWCPAGACDVHGEILRHDWEEFLCAIPSLEEVGTKALLINCLPRDRIAGTLPAMRKVTDLPLGVYPNIGRFVDPGWQFDSSVTPEAYALEARRWRDEELAQIVGGCCGVTTEHIARTVQVLSC
jgi:S-methylmethionine-dependent homocysteine/selenocysteine methylase